MSKPPVRIECSASEAFRDWLARAGGAMVVTTYQAGKVAVVGWDGARVTLLMREFDKPLGMAIADDRMVLATRNDVWLLANAPLLARDYLEDQPGRYDALYLPRATYHTGDLNIHDVALSGEDVILVNTRFSCLARLSADHSFTPFWRPPFVTDLVPEDRCHLNGLAMRDGRPRVRHGVGHDGRGGSVAREEGDRRRGDRRRDGRRSWPAAWRCPIRPGGTTGGSGCSIPAPASCSRSIRPPGGRRWFAACPAICEGCVSWGRTRWWGCARFARSTFSAGCRSRSAVAALRCAVAVIDLRRRDRGGHVRVHRGLRGALRRAVSAGREASDDSQPGEVGGARGDDESRVFVLAAAEFGDPGRGGFERPRRPEPRAIVAGRAAGRRIARGTGTRWAKRFRTPESNLRTERDVAFPIA